MKKKSSELSQPGKLIRKRAEDIILTETMKAQFRALKDIEPDMSDPDAPEFTNWDKAVVGKFYRPVKKQLTIRIDMNVFEWFQQNSNHYQTLINEVCKEYMMKHQKTKKRSSHAKKI